MQTGSRLLQHRHFPLIHQATLLFRELLLKFLLRNWAKIFHSPTAQKFLTGFLHALSPALKQPRKRQLYHACMEEYIIHSITKTVFTAVSWLQRMNNVFLHTSVI